MSAPNLPSVGPVLLHQGGWDEMLILATPIVLFLVVRWVARRRQGDDDRDEEEGE